ncbi:MAG: prepilin peptidase [Myxococcota bacterium]
MRFLALRAGPGPSWTVALGQGSLPLLAAILGALVGSFLNVVIARCPHGESIVWPGSRCPHCADPIPWYLNVPVLSWLALGGRCRQCRRPISLRYPVVELLTALLFVACAARYGVHWGTPFGWLFVSGLVVTTFVDLDHWEIPDEISLPGIVLGCLLRPGVFDVPWWSGIVGALLGGGFLWLVRGFYLLLRRVEGMGLGDVKLLAMIGAFLGPGSLLPVILVSSVFGSVIGFIALLAARDPHPSEIRPEASTEAEVPDGGPDEGWTPPPNAIPFGPFLALGGIAQMLLGPWLARLLFGWV